MREFTRTLEKGDCATRVNNVAWTKVQDCKQETVSDVSVCIQIVSRNALPNSSRFIDLYLISIPNMQVEWFQVSSTQFVCSLIMMYQLLTLRAVVVWWFPLLVFVESAGSILGQDRRFLWIFKTGVVKHSICVRELGI